MRMQSWQRCARGVGLGLALAVLTAAGAAADAIPYFDGPGRIGFANALGIPPDFDIGGQLNLPGLTIRQKVKKVKFQGGAYNVQIKLKIKNRTGAAIDDLLLLITALAQPASVAPTTPIELELGGAFSGLAIAQLQGTPERFFAGLEIGTLPNKGRFKTKLQYRVLGDLATGRASPLVFTIGTQPTPLPVPEPGTALLLAVGGGVLGGRCLLQAQTARR